MPRLYPEPGNFPRAESAALRAVNSHNVGAEAVGPRTRKPLHLDHRTVVAHRLCWVRSGRLTDHGQCP